MEGMREWVRVEGETERQGTWNGDKAWHLTGLEELWY